MSYKWCSLFNMWCVDVEELIDDNSGDKLLVLDPKEVSINNVVEDEEALNKKDLATIMGALIDKSIGIKHMIEIKDYVSKEELESLKKQSKIVDKIANKVSKLINS
ncbi:hypothetical protein K8O96_11960 [Clostridium sporogenes]|uniref:Uncharacterized protein n=1 Tax=Clostridium botulinum TaxID=1491 RepID=A0A6M0SZY4_CLOBO|nr:hypothetical protein [Clostridium sporogenes]NFA59491.1 hypothetical protein [Clostridium botulinum]NFI74675.1 hypothetical protein [Clostridium sporogenes]NFL71190.1 hypothetical protein [Clostridium sporogenes]NFM26131.1 hypothetical protein [Clostridium sporogenes]NFP62463.1 hypothetical protein [Clostridium sporogenes]